MFPSTPAGAKPVDKAGGSTRGGSNGAGTALGARNAANSLGPASGALIGGALFVWQMNVPYVLSGGLLVAIAVAIAGTRWAARRPRIEGEDAEWEARRSA